MAQVMTRRIKVVGNQLCIVSESFSIIGKSPYVKAFLEGYVSIWKIHKL